MDVPVKMPPFWTALSNTDNVSWSFARVTTGALIAATIFWISWIVIKTEKIPDNLPGLATVLLALYGVNRAAEAYETRAPNPPTTLNINPDATSNTSTTVVNP